MRTAQLAPLLMFFATLPVAAQNVPSPSSLARIGLERAWVSQARVDPSRGRLTHLTVDERYVYAQASNGSITAFDAETGNRHWVVRLGSPDRLTFAATSNSELVLVVTGTRVYGVEKSSGHVMWTAKMPASASTSALMDGEFFYIGTTDGSVYAFNMAVVAYKERTGRLPGSFDPGSKQISSPVGPVAASHIWMWRYRTGRSLSQPPILASGSIMLGDTKGQVYGITPGPPENLGGKLIFQFQAGQGRTGAMLTKGPTTYIATGDNRLVAVDSVEGQIRWRYSVGHRILGSPLLVANRIYLAAESEGLIAIDLEAGRQAATANGPWWVRGATEMVGVTASSAYASDRQWNLIAVDRETGSPRGQIPLFGFKERIKNDLNDRIYVASEQGLIMCLRPTGAEEPTFYRNADCTPITPIIADDQAPIGSGTKEGIGSGTKEGGDGN